MRPIFRILTVVLATICLDATARPKSNTISLSGRWSVRLDPDSTGVNKGFQHGETGKPINLPGTLDEAGYGTPTAGSDYGILTRRHKYTGPAWYSREIVIPREWKDREVVLDLERVMWQSEAWIDGERIDTQDGLGTPHRHRLGKLSPGHHRLCVRVNNDMIYNIGDKGHAYGEYTQIIWNGMIGRIELSAMPTVSLSDIQVWPDATNNRIGVTFTTTNDNQPEESRIVWRLTEINSRETVLSLEESLTTPQGERAHDRMHSLTVPVKLWDEFERNLYRLELTLKNGKQTDYKQIDFGFRDLSSARSKIRINNNATFLRGNLDCVHFPLTGYPSCDTAEWGRIFRIYKAHGLNHVRFHSWCPPEAAFTAADKEGVYIQAEAVWIDWWMATVNPDRPEMTTKGLPKGLGHNPSADTYIPAELKRMLDAYGNHPSFVMLCIGNELGNSDFEVMQKWIEELKTADPRRLYAVSTARQVTSVDDYMATHHFPGAGNTYGLSGDGTDFDLEKTYAKATIPVIAHELGQFPVYPLWSEIAKYSGVLEARNLKEFRETARKNGIEVMDSAFHEASGALQTLFYKAHIEALLRTPSCAGFQMLSMTDYSGQGEALVGWLDSFWDSKGIVDPDDFRRYSNTVVPLARFAKYIWSNDETFRFKLETANYGRETLCTTLHWKLSDTEGEILTEGSVDKQELTAGCLNSTSTEMVEIPLKSVGKAGKYRLTVELKDTPYANSWNIWVYPAVTTPENKNILTTETLDDKALEHLAQGGKVLLLAHHSGREGGFYPLTFEPLFWSNSFFPGQSTKTLGMVIDRNHPALSEFPTDSHSDWQWKPISRGRTFIVNNHPNLKPIVQPISDFHINDRLASIFECRVGNGSLMVCGHDLNGDSPVAGQMRYSLLNYMQGADFKPQYEMQPDELREMFYRAPTAQAVIPAGFEEAILFVECGRQSETDGAVAWSKQADRIATQENGCDYKVICENVWKDADGTAWTGSEITVEITTPNGIIGDLYVKFEDWNELNRTGILNLEGRESILENHAGKAGQWIKLFVMREDTNDGKITLKAKAKSGGNLMISRIAFIKQ